jgi:hypothetical protein
MTAVVVIAWSEWLPAQTTTCELPSDCDNDGVNNFEDVCPAVTGNTFRPAVTGFADIACYRPLLPTVTHCIPVAARPFDENVPDDAFQPQAGATHRKGFTFVGIFDTAAGGPAAAPPYQNQADAASAGGVGPQFPTNTLFACFGSVEFNQDGTVKRQSDVVYGFRIAAGYARAVNRAALHAEGIGLGSTFNDALGLIESVREETFRSGIVGTAGTWDHRSWWGTNSSYLVNVHPSELPRVEPGASTPACIDPRIIVRTPGPFGFPATVPRQIPQNPVPRVPRFAADEFVEAGNLQVVDTADCTTSLPREAYVFYNYSVIIFPNIGMPIPGGQTIDRWWIDEPKVWPRAVEQFAGNGLLRSDGFAQFKLGEPRPPRGPYRATVAADIGEIAQLTGSSWTVVKGAAFSALQATRLEARSLAEFSQADSNGRRSISARLNGWEIADRVYHWEFDGWVNWVRTGAGLPSQVNANVPQNASPDSEPYPFSEANAGSHLNVQFTADPWHPAGDYWESNATGSCGTLSQRFPHNVGPNPSVSVPEEWCPRPLAPPASNVLENFSNRLSLCDAERYEAGNPDLHWPLLQRRVPFATLYGHLFTPGAPTAQFPGGGTDLVFAGVENTFNRLHEGLDINWEMKEAFADPSSRRIFGNYEEFQCWGTLFVEAAELEIPVSCDSQEMRLCGSLAGPRGAPGCNPVELAWERWKADAAEACRCNTINCGPLTWLCTRASCWANFFANCMVGNAVRGARFLYDSVNSYAKGICVAWSGTRPCADRDPFSQATPFVLHRDRTFAPGKREMEHELEYNVAFGVSDPVLGRQDDCGEALGDNILVSSVCKWHEDNSSYKHKNWLYTDSDLNNIAVGTNQSAVAISRFFSSGVPNGVWPVVFGPGLFQSADGVWGKMATTAGHSPAFSNYDSIPKLQVLSPDLVHLLPTNSSNEHPFRLELLGDLIVDCGHNPLRPEIHPPASVYMHLGGGRYSLFGWHRIQNGNEGPIVIDLWPGAPKPRASSQLQANVIYDRGITLAAGSFAGRWACSKFPAEAPDRFRCTKEARGSPRGSDDSDQCEDNPRMLPSCEDGVAGGIVDVSWQ